MAICGNSAILALSPIIGARHRETAYAVSTITLFGLLGVLALPVLGAAPWPRDATFGTWAGLAVNDTAQVVATGYAFSPPAGDVATIVKLTRNLAILPVLLGATWLAVAPRSRSNVPEMRPAPTSPLAMVARAVPWFVLGFVVFAALRSAGLLDGALPTGGTLADLCSTLASLLILVALAGVGLATDVRAMLGVGAAAVPPWRLDLDRRSACSGSCLPWASRRPGARGGLPWRRPMDVELILTPGLGNGAFLLAADGEAVVVDPPRDAWRVMAAAEARGWRLTHVLETHVHNDYLSGALELRSSLGVEILAPARGRYAFAHRPIDDGGALEVDGLRLTARATPGHTPEHLAWEVVGGR